MTITSCLHIASPSRNLSFSVAASPFSARIPFNKWNIMDCRSWLLKKSSMLSMSLKFEAWNKKNLEPVFLFFIYWHMKYRILYVYFKVVRIKLRRKCIIDNIIEKEMLRALFSFMELTKRNYSFENNSLDSNLWNKRIFII